MSRQNVKNTIFERMLQNIAPHLCCGCGKVGMFLCDECKNDIIYEPFLGCVWCGMAICKDKCRKRQFISKVWVVSQRHHAIKRAINSYKFQYIRYGSFDLARLLLLRVPLLPSNIIVTSIPTLTSHQRTRGYDHAGLLARQFASSAGLLYLPLLSRRKGGTQHASNRHDRIVQAQNAYSVNKSYEINGAPILLIDDIITTGSTIQSAAKALSGISSIIFVAALAYQPLDE